MAKVLLGVTGSVAAIRTPALVQALLDVGHQVKVVATEPSLYFFNPAELPAGMLNRDADEWFRRQAGDRYQREDPVLHIELRRWADLFLIAPLDANTLAKLATGLCDNCLTCVWRAWDPARPAVLAPAMNTFMWENPLTARHLRDLIALHADRPAPVDASLHELVQWLNERCRRLHLVHPQTKRLACGDVGMGGLADVVEIVSVVQKVLG